VQQAFKQKAKSHQGAAAAAAAQEHTKTVPIVSSCREDVIKAS
jgi:hypothetical protein